MQTDQDSSHRFIAQGHDPVVQNMAALWMVDASLARRLEAAMEGPLPKPEASRSGQPTIAIETQTARQYLHSRVKPLEEAQEQLKSVDTKTPLAFYVQGFGLGYLTAELFGQASSEALICVIEPDERLLASAMQAVDHSKMISSGRILFFTRLDKSDLFMRLSGKSALLTLGLTGIAHAASVRLNPEFFGQYVQWMADFAAYWKTSLNTLVINGKKTLENVAANIHRYATNPGIDHLENSRRGKVGIVVSAGPSLRKNIHLLKDVANLPAEVKPVIIAVQTTLQPLLDMGVTPDFVTSLDYHSISTRFYQRLPKELSTTLVAEAKASSEIFDLFPGKVLLLGNEHADSILRELKPSRGKLPAGATVAHLSFYLAQYLGCDPILFMGQDLGFSDGLCYSPGTSYDDVWQPELSRFCTLEMKQWEQIARDRMLLRKIPDVNGRPMYTEERLFTYLQQFERDFGTATQKIIDCTEGGAFKIGSRPMLLREALDEFVFKQDISKSGSGVNASYVQPENMTATENGNNRSAMKTQYSYSSINQCLHQRAAEAGTIARISRKTLPLLEEIREKLEDQHRVNQLIARIDLLRRDMNDFGQTYDLITQMNQRSELQRFTSDRRVAATTDPTEKQQRQVERDIENVRAIAQAAEEFEKLMLQQCVDKNANTQSVSAGGHDASMNKEAA